MFKIYCKNFSKIEGYVNGRFEKNLSSKGVRL